MMEILHEYYTTVRCMTEKEWKKFSAGYEAEILEKMTRMEFPDYIQWCENKGLTFLSPTYHID